MGGDGLLGTHPMYVTFATFKGVDIGQRGFSNIG